ncbi:MAG: hypothetical protein ACI88L_000231 [Candidatus Paceibacteria bacterium]|jgi:hypothetical protein
MKNQENQEKPKAKVLSIGGLKNTPYDAERLKRELASFLNPRL